MKKAMCIMHKTEAKGKKDFEEELSSLHIPRRTSGVTTRPSTATELEYYEKYKKNVEEEFPSLLKHHGASCVTRRPPTATKLEYYENYLDINLRSSDFDLKFATLRENVTKNWTFVKENSSPFAWLRRFKERNWLAMSVINDGDITQMNIERRDLAEFFLIKALKKGTCKTLHDIEFLASIFLMDIEQNSKQRKTQEGSASCHVKHDQLFILSNNQPEIERFLNRQDVITIKDYLLEESIITFEENEELVNDKNYYERNKKHLFSQVVKKAVEYSDKNSFQYLNHHIENIIRKKSSGQRFLQTIMERRNSKMQTAIKSSSITVQEKGREEFAKNTGQNDSLSMRIKIVNQQNGNELTSFYNQVHDHPEATNTSMAQFGANCDGVEMGSVVLHFHPLDRNRKLKFDGNFEDLIKMLLKEADIGNTIPCGEYTLIAEVNVTQSPNKMESEFLPLTDKINFVAAEITFLEDEIDADAILEGFQIRQRTIADINPFDDRKTNARKIFKAIIDDNLEDEFICILREYSMKFILARYEKYMTVYSSDTAVLRSSIIRQFSRIIRDIHIYEVREVMLDLHIVDESTLNSLESKFEDRKDIAMATLILNILKSGNAIHAFAYALYLREYNPLVETVLSEKQHNCDADLENGTSCYSESRDKSPLFRGCFNVICRKEETEKEHVLDEPIIGSGMEICATNCCNKNTVGMNGGTQITSTHMDYCEDRKRYCIVAFAFLEIVTPRIKQKLKSNYERKGFRNLHGFIDCDPVKHTLFHLRHKKNRCCVDTKKCISGTGLPLTYQQWDSLYKKNQEARSHHCHCIFTANDVQMNTIDFNLASLILLKCCKIAPEEEMLITNLQQFQDNFLRHNIDGLISQVEFITLWKDLTAYVDELDPSQNNEMVRKEETTRDVSLHDGYVTISVASKINKMKLEELSGFVEACKRKLLQ